MTQEILAQVLEIIAEATSLPREQITVDSTFEEMGIVSLESIDLLIAIEDAFHVSLRTRRYLSRA